MRFVVWKMKVGWKFSAISASPKSQESNNSSIPRPSGRFTSFGSVLNEIHADDGQCRGGICWKVKFRKISIFIPPQHRKRTHGARPRGRRGWNGGWGGWFDYVEWVFDGMNAYGSALRLSDTMRDEKFDKFIKSTKSNAIVHHHVPYCLFVFSIYFPCEWEFASLHLASDGFVRREASSFTARQRSPIS